MEKAKLVTMGKKVAFVAVVSIGVAIALSTLANRFKLKPAQYVLQKSATGV